MKGKSALFHRLKDLRQDNDKSQSDIAEVLNTSQSYYAQYERGERPLTLERALQIADFYGVSLDYLAGRTNVKAVSTANPVDIKRVSEKTAPKKT